MLLCFIMRLRVYISHPLSLSTSRLLGQVVQATVDYLLWQKQGNFLTFRLGDIPLLSWLLVSLSLLVVVVVNEVVKLHEIRYEVEHRMGLFVQLFLLSSVICYYVNCIILYYYCIINIWSVCSDEMGLDFHHLLQIRAFCPDRTSWSPLSFPGCVFATRRGRSCSLKQSWGWTLHFDAFLSWAIQRTSQPVLETREEKHANTVGTLRWLQPNGTATCGWRHQPNVKVEASWKLVEGISVFFQQNSKVLITYWEEPEVGV